MSIVAIVNTLEAGYDYQKDTMLKLGFKLNDRFNVESINMGQSSTSIYLKDYKESFNSVFFKFEENNIELDIYSDPRFNPYIRR